MVQYILTPWRDRRELLKVRQQFYPAALPPAALPSADYASSAALPASATATVATASSAPVSASGLPTAPPTTRTQGVLVPAPTPAPTSTGGESPMTSAIGGSSSPNVDNDRPLLLLLAAQHHAVARVSMWMQRGNCPHMVESTALLTAAILSDGESQGSAGTYAVRAAYAAAFSRFVTGLLDGHQDKQRKLSMYSVAKTIGLPATFVELRHQATHETLPSLAKLRSAARKALVWIWEYYWQHLGSEDEVAVEVGENEGEGWERIEGSEKKVGVATAAAGRAVVVAFLEEQDEARRADMKRWIDGLDEARLLATLDKITETPPNNVVLLAALRLSKEILQKRQSVKSTEQGHARDVDEIERKISQARDVLAAETQDAAEISANDAKTEEAQEVAGTGWARFEGTWKPRPIGVA
ncbi:Pre-rRNA-processing protein las1 [Colletotrichum tanaceti]|uniref:Pre-rRNA-processing protein las1 n=1 Tax=Colletotrichum tanaceti TaxID=1306861 RepID=A0A4U6XJC2_9PEZI|nr:Pre-rRNA-processing protein las1 [Colletotrichum tanaceti]